MMRIVRSTLAILLSALCCVGQAQRARALPMDSCPALGNEIAQVMVDVDSAFARTRPDFGAPTLTRLIKFQCFYAIGRNQIGDFVLVRDGSSKLWISKQDIRTRGEESKLPVTPEVVGGSTLAISRNVRGLPAVGPRARQIYASAASAGRDLGVVSVMGDCNSEPPVFFGRVASGAFSPAAYGLSSAAARFSKSWARWSLATSGSFNTGSALDASWSNPQKCAANETPLGCELRDSRASVLLISVGTGDQFAWQQFAGRLSQIVNETIANGALPVLITKADALESQQGGAPADSINNAIRSVGAQYGIPVIDLAVAAAELPNGGLANEPPPQFHLSTEGETLKLVMTLATLEQIASGVAYSPPAAPAPAPASAPTPTVVARPAATVPAQATSVAPTAVPTAGTASATPTAQSVAAATATSPDAGIFKLRSGGVNMRAGPSTTADVLVTGTSAQEFAILGKSTGGDWWQVRLVDGRPAWVLSNLGDVVTKQATPTSAGTLAVVHRRLAILRSTAGFDAPANGMLYVGQLLQVVNSSASTTDGWLEVRVPSENSSGWIQREQLLLIERP